MIFGTSQRQGNEPTGISGEESILEQWETGSRNGAQCCWGEGAMRGLVKGYGWKGDGARASLPSARGLKGLERTLTFALSSMGANAEL